VPIYGGLRPAIFRNVMAAGTPHVENTVAGAPTPSVARREKNQTATWPPIPI